MWKFLEVCLFWLRLFVEVVFIIVMDTVVGVCFVLVIVDCIRCRRLS